MNNTGKLSKTWWIVIGAVALILIYLMFSYNNFVTLNQNINGKWSEVENQYQRQADLIPNFVSSVSSQVSVETKFVKDIVAARTAYASATTALAKDAAGQQMNSGISAFVSAVAENYPVLQASEGYTGLRDELAGTQNRITVARGEYIKSIKSYNVAIMRFPARLVAGMFGFGAKEYYTAEEGSLGTPELGAGVLP